MGKVETVTVIANLRYLEYDEIKPVFFNLNLRF